MKRILLSLAHMSGKEEEFIREAFDSNWVVPLGPNVDGFERDLEAWIRKKAGREVHVVALSSGTAAMSELYFCGFCQPGLLSGRHACFRRQRTGYVEYRPSVAGNSD